MDNSLIRSRSIQIIKRFGVTVPSTLPFLDTDLALRPVREIVDRILAMHAVVASAYGFKRQAALMWLDREKLLGSVTESEREFLVSESGLPELFQVRVESMWAIAWALGFVSGLDFAKSCNSQFVITFPNLKNNEDSSSFRKNIRPRSLEDIVGMCDVAYCLHWVILDSRLRGKKHPSELKEQIVVERRRALEWILSASGWDDVSLDT